MVFSITSESDGDDWLITLQQSPAAVSDAVEQYTRNELQPLTTARVGQTLMREPGPVKHPIQWQSEKQRRAYFATDGFGHGIPYRRTGRYARGWRTFGVYRPQSSAIIVFNPWKKAGFVGGFQQQQMHKITGWTFAPGALRAIQLEVEKRASADLPGVIESAFEGLS